MSRQIILTEKSIQSLASPLRLLSSLDHLIRSRQHVRLNRQADLLRRFQVDDQFELRGLLDRQIGWLRTLEDFVHVCSSSPEQVGDVRSIRHQPPGLHELASKVHSRELSL